MPCWDVEGGEDVFGFGGQGIGGCEVVAVEGDGDVLEVAGYGQVGLIRVASPAWTAGKTSVLRMLLAGDDGPGRLA